MPWLSILLHILSIVGTGLAADSIVYKDPDTGFTFSQYNANYKYQSPNVITFRTAVPTSATAPYDVVLQLTALKEVAWLGLSWGGTMLNNPLTVVWPNGNTVTISSRLATQRSQPTAYAGETLQVLKTGTKVNSTHWEVTLKCSGCTSWTSSSGSTTTLNPNGSNRLAFAYSSTAPSTPSSNTSSFGVHDLFGYWNQDFSQGQNADFQALVSKNS
ncbi:hypothetical protein J7T55_003757 [Diaporthe amygdali]|uniref:uncharacterized protein n=1 Tax=Phomopsis amygdali TaxID=1214568 RepID=UPI0022FE0EDB|nr:uncharacterized protein J7T55_003757 [Diaporthe amygdali]KAJ0117343.1 hypothetical protein J7T55_003757 [Diaporthe amygdali]